MTKIFCEIIDNFLLIITSRIYVETLIKNVFKRLSEVTGDFKLSAVAVQFLNVLSGLCVIIVLTSPYQENEVLCL